MNFDIRIPLGEWIAAALDWIKLTFDDGLGAIATVLRAVVAGLGDALIAVPAPLLILVFALLAWLVRSWQLAVGTAVTMVLIVTLDQWDNAMLTLSLVLVAAVIAVIIAVPLGILAARSDGFSATIRPVLDFLQTMPALVYLIPAVTFFSVGFVPGVFATVLFALPPGVRFTELGIRGVDAETVEAGHAFGSTPGKILRGIQLPLAAPTIMAGVNQVIMLSLSMAVMAGMAGANGLGKEVVSALATLDTGKGVEAGLSVVILAVFLDRVTAALGTPAAFPHSLLGATRKRRDRRRTAQAQTANTAG
ncbi:ABC transporter permease [Leucobacter sp. 1207-22]|uniref:ABC transporter permease n=1 Tax=Leucobacter sp. 1207-22 TaxID=2604456 RepID=UPI0040644FB9